MEMNYLTIWLSWACVIAVGIYAIGYWLGRQRKISWLRRIKMPKMFEPKPDDLTEKLKAQTEIEKKKAEELRKVLEAKTELAKARAENIGLQREIDGVSEKSVAKGKRAVETEKQEEVKVKPRRL